MKKQVSISLTFLFIMLFCLINLMACDNQKNHKFNSFDEMKAALPDGFCYFDIDFGEAKEFSVTKWSKSIHNDENLFRYSIWYDIKNPYGELEYQLNVVGTHSRKPISILPEYINTGELIKNAIVLYSFDFEDNLYYFILRGLENYPEKTAADKFKNIIESIVKVKGITSVEFVERK